MSVYGTSPQGGDGAEQGPRRALSHPSPLSSPCGKWSEPPLMLGRSIPPSPVTGVGCVRRAPGRVPSVFLAAAPRRGATCGRAGLARSATGVDSGSGWGAPGKSRLY